MEYYHLHPSIENHFMTKRDFFRVIIKLFGLYTIIVTVFNVLPTHVQMVAFDYLDPFVILWALLVLIVTVLIFVWLIFKTDKLIDWLRLDRGFDDERINFESFNGVNIVKFAAIIIGGFLILDHFPLFLNHSYYALKKAMIEKGVSSDLDSILYDRPIDYFNWAISAINMVIGYVLLTNYHIIANWLTRNANKKDIM